MLVLPDSLPGALPESVSELPSLRVRPLVGFCRIIRDFVFAWRWAKRCEADLVVLPHEWGLPIGHVPLVSVVQNVYYLTPPNGRRGWAKGDAHVRRHPDDCASCHDDCGCLGLRCKGVVRQHATTGDSGAPGRPPTVPARGRTCEVSPRSPDDWTAPLQATRSGRRGGTRALVDADPNLRVVVVGLPTAHRTVWETHDHLAPDALASLFGMAKVVAVTSELESFGLPAFEARSAGASVVVGTPMDEMLDQDEGVSSTNPTAPDFLREISTAVSAPPPQVTSRYEWTAVANEWVELVGMVAGGNPPRMAPSATGQ